MHYFYGILIATGVIVGAEIAFDYSLGDFLKDFFIHAFKGAEAVLKAQVARAENRYRRVLGRVRQELKAVLPFQGKQAPGQAQKGDTK
jgi:hypothetical protein